MLAKAELIVFAYHFSKLVEVNLFVITVVQMQLNTFKAKYI